jgi:hypothetical protein
MKVLVRFLALSTILFLAMAQASPAAQPRQTVILDVYASLSFMAEIVEATRKIVESRSPWLRIRVQDAAQDEMYKLYISSPPEKRKTMVMWALENGIDSFAAGLRPDIMKKGELKPLPMVMMKFGPLGCSGFGTVDEKILTPHDFVGKKVDLHSPTNATGAWGLVLEVSAVKDKTSLVFSGGLPRMVSFMKNRQAAVSLAHMTGVTRPVPQVIQLMTEDRFYLVDVTREGIDKVARTYTDVFHAIYPQPIYQGDLPRVLGLKYEPVRQPVVYCFGGQNPHWIISPEADPEVVQEFVSVQLKHKDDFEKFVTGDVKALKEGLSQTARPKSQYHPGARRAFEEFRLDYGVNSLVESEKARAKAHGQEFYVPDYLEARLRRR